MNLKDTINNELLTMNVHNCKDIIVKTIVNDAIDKLCYDFIEIYMIYNNTNNTNNTTDSIISLLKTLYKTLHFSRKKKKYPITYYLLYNKIHKLTVSNAFFYCYSGKISDILNVLNHIIDDNHEEIENFFRKRLCIFFDGLISDFVYFSIYNIIRDNIMKTDIIKDLGLDIDQCCLEKNILDKNYIDYNIIRDTQNFKKYGMHKCIIDYVSVLYDINIDTIRNKLNFLH